jgi:hypothetical protein
VTIVLVALLAVLVVLAAVVGLVVSRRGRVVRPSARPSAGPATTQAPAPVRGDGLGVKVLSLITHLTLPTN